MWQNNGVFFFVEQTVNLYDIGLTLFHFPLGENKISDLEREEMCVCSIGALRRNWHTNSVRRLSHQNTSMILWQKWRKFSARNRSYVCEWLALFFCQYGDSRFHDKVNCRHFPLNYFSIYSHLFMMKVIILFIEIGRKVAEFRLKILTIEQKMCSNVWILQYNHELQSCWACVNIFLTVPKNCK